ncbi:MAG: 50S ribosomal protein L18 [Bacilli bacterium]|jgi:large subunit ribosomal protein L18
MVKQIKRKQIRTRLHKRVRAKVSGTSERPRLAVYCSNKHIYAQVIDDTKGHTLASASSLNLKLENGGNVEAATKVGEAIAKVALENNINTVVFDRGGFLYHGRVKALADAARKEGLQF